MSEVHTTPGNHSHTEIHKPDTPCPDIGPTLLGILAKIAHGQPVPRDALDPASPTAKAMRVIAPELGLMIENPKSGETLP